jgi:2,3-bisphosphoglycerate-dependent phosphoglycerate mutase
MYIIFKTFFVLIHVIDAFGLKPIHTLLLCRHGDSIWNGGEDGTKERFTGWTDIPLSNKGEMEAVGAGKVLSSYKNEIDICFTSHLQRSKNSAEIICNTMRQRRRSNLDIVEDYRLGERHYGSLQGFVKQEVEAGLYGHKPEEVKLWRRSWHVIPPLLKADDPRRLDEIKQFSKVCGGSENIPIGESLQMVAYNRIRPFVASVLAPCLHSIWKGKRSESESVTGMIVGHANSLRALIGVLCEIESDDLKLESLEELRIPTCAPLVLQFQFDHNGQMNVYSIPEVGLKAIPVISLIECKRLMKEVDEDIFLQSKSFNRTLVF